MKKMIRALLVVVGLVVGGYTIMGIVRHNEMSQIVNSEEVKEIYLKRYLIFHSISRTTLVINTLLIRKKALIAPQIGLD